LPTTLAIARTDAAPARPGVLALGLATGLLIGLAACPHGDDGDAPIDDCLAIAQQAPCDDANGCVWVPAEAQCLVDCAAIDDRDTCNGQDVCFWDGLHCNVGAI
jgi:hypothetical protein